MSVPDVTAPRDARYWLVPISRGVVAIGVAIAITFNTNHSAQVGYLSFGAFALLSGLVLAGLSLAVMTPGIARSLFVVQGVVGIIIGAIALVSSSAGLPLFLLLLTGWAAITGFLELYIGLRSRGRIASARDWLFAGILTAVFALVILLIPSDIQQSFAGVQKEADGTPVEGMLTSSIIVVGLVGAYAAILGVYLVIGGLSLKWGTQRADAPAVSSKDGIS